MNERSECPEKYKTSVINSFIRRAYKNCSSWELFDKEIKRVKQILINNGYSNGQLDNMLAKFLIKQLNPLEKKNESVLQLFYNNQMNSGYKVDERIMKEIVANNIKKQKRK